MTTQISPTGMPSTGTDETGPRTYGGWRLARGYGIGGLSGRQTLIVVVTVLVVLGALLISVPAALSIAPLGLMVVVVAVARWHGVPLVDAAVARIRWWRATAAGWNEYRAGVVVDHPRAFQLPGVLAPLLLLSAEDYTGHPYGVVWDRRTGLLSATIRVAAASPWLADATAADMWVANWGAWLTGLGYRPTIRWVTVTVDTAPEAGATLADRVTARIDPSAPAPARDMMAALVDASPSAAADVETRVTITIDPAASPTRPGTLLEQIAELDHELEALTSGLGGCGVSVIGRATPAELAAVVRTAYDPASRGEVDRALESPITAADQLSWDNAGPVSASEEWDCYRHDSGWSISWALHEPPRQSVNSSVLAQLMAPGAYAKRVTLLYMPLPADAAAAWVEQQTHAATFRSEVKRRTGQDTTQREMADYANATRAAREEAQGAGVVRFSAYVTATCLDQTQLPRMSAVVESSAQQSRVRLRRMFGSQQAGFAATLPLGICPPFLSTKRPR